MDSALSQKCSMCSVISTSTIYICFTAQKSFKSISKAVHLISSQLVIQNFECGCLYVTKQVDKTTKHKGNLQQLISKCYCPAKQ